MKPQDAPFSASEVSLYRECLRKGAAKYLTDDPQWRVPQKPSAHGGTLLHAIAEPYLRDGTYPKEHNAAAELFMAGIPYLPPPRSGVVEMESLASYRGIPFLRVLDWAGDAKYIGGVGRGVLDHKTSVNPKEYGIWSVEERLDDPQTLTYGLEGDAPRDTFYRHVYYRKTADLMQMELDWYREQPDPDIETILRYQRKIERGYKNPWVKPSDCFLEAGQISGGLDRVVMPVAEKIYSLRLKGVVDPLSLPPTPASCDSFGGCPHRSRCNLSPSEQFRGLLFKESEMGLFEKMKVNPPATSLPSAVAPQAAQAPQAPAQPAFQFGNAATKVPKAEPPPAAPAAPPAVAEGLTPEMLAQGVEYFCKTFARALRAAADVLDEG